MQTKTLLENQSICGIQLYISIAERVDSIVESIKKQ